MNDEERLRVLVRALLPFALAADDDYVRTRDDNYALATETGWDDEYVNIHILSKDGDIHTKHGKMRELNTGDLRAALAAITAAGYADALEGGDARAALGGDDICEANEIIDDDDDARD